MSKPSPLPLAALALALAACQPDASSSSANTASPAPAAEALPDDRGQPAAEVPGNAAAIANEAADQTVPVTAIPAAFHGRWGLVPADCTSTRSDAKGLLTVTGEMLAFYESRARLDEVVSSYPEKFTAKFAFSGEGQNWTKIETLELTGSSNTLVRSESGAPDRFRYARCPAA